jgi:hypothetical protein
MSLLHDLLAAMGFAVVPVPAKRGGFRPADTHRTSHAASRGGDWPEGDDIAWTDSGPRRSGPPQSSGGRIV